MGGSWKRMDGCALRCASSAHGREQVQYHECSIEVHEQATNTPHNIMHCWCDHHIPLIGIRSKACLPLIWLHMVTYASIAEFSSRSLNPW